MIFRELHPDLQPWAKWLYDTAQLNGLRPRVTSTYRSVSHQARLYDEYQKGLRRYPVARPGCSQHNYRVAFDLVSEDNAWLGSLWQSVGGYWGGNRDPVHFGIKWFPCS